MSMVAVGDPGAFQRLPDMYMRKMAVGPVARGKIDLTLRLRPPEGGDALQLVVSGQITAAEPEFGRHGAVRVGEVGDRELARGRRLVVE